MGEGYDSNNHERDDGNGDDDSNGKMTVEVMASRWRMVSVTVTDQ